MIHLKCIVVRKFYGNTFFFKEFHPLFIRLLKKKMFMDINIL